MKKILWLLAAGLMAFWACNSGKSESQAKEENKDHSHEAVTVAKPEQLSLNNGARWKSDESTNKNVQQMQLLVTNFYRSPNRTALSYTSLANDLNVAIQKMIEECRMQGADHAALHKWLEPLMINVQKMQKTKNEEDAAALLSGITGHLKIFNQYFE